MGNVRGRWRVSLGKQAAPWGWGLTQQVLGRAGHCVGIEGREHTTLPRAHVEAPAPEVIFLRLHQHWVIHIQLQLVRMARDEPEVRERSVRQGRPAGHALWCPICGLRLWIPKSKGKLYLKTARWVCSLSSPLTRQEKRPKDSVPETYRRGRDGARPTQGKGGSQAWPGAVAKCPPPTGSCGCPKSKRERKPAHQGQGQSRPSPTPCPQTGLGRPSPALG